MLKCRNKIISLKQGLLVCMFTPQHLTTYIRGHLDTLSGSIKRVKLLYPLAKFPFITVYNSEYRVCIIILSGLNINVSIVHVKGFLSHNVIVSE